MPPTQPRPRYSLVESDAERDLDSFAEEVEAGFAEHPKRLPFRFFYDEEGSRLFEEICEVPEYYLTRTERAILKSCADELVAHFEGPTLLAELGSGSSTKTRVLIEAFLRRHGGLAYVPVDISRSILEESALELLERYRGLQIRAIASEYQEGLRHLRHETGQPKLIAWLGSTVGNFHRRDATRFLTSVRNAMVSADRLLIGIDLRKERQVLERAYDDERGVTARFNLNLLARINRELGGRFELSRFRHRARYDEVAGRVEMHLVSTEDQEVEIEHLGLRVRFGAGEGIHTENSYKYSLDEIEQLGRGADLRVADRWFDPQQRFSLNLFAPA
jgi:L-histidine N-alpha-methyltransferase